MEEHLDNDLRACPTLFQEYIEKRCDVRITVVDGDIHSTELYAKESDGSQRCDIRRNNMDDVTYRCSALSKETAAGVRMMMLHYGLRFAAIDMVVDTHGRWYFLEINPNGQWAWLDLVGGSTIATSFVKTFSEQC